MRISDWSSDVCSSDLSTDISVQQAASGEIAHQRADAAGPGGRLGAGPHAVDQRAEPRPGDAHDVADLVGKAAPRLVAVLRRREPGAEEQDEAGGLMMFAHRLAQPVLGDAADTAGRSACKERGCKYS